jgi:hypothetical protein
MYLKSIYIRIQFLFPEQKNKIVPSLFFSKCNKFYFLICVDVDDIRRRTNERTHIHEQKTEKCVFERRLIVCIKDRRKKNARERAKSANAENDNTCTK